MVRAAVLCLFVSLLLACERRESTEAKADPQNKPIALVSTAAPPPSPSPSIEPPPPPPPPPPLALPKLAKPSPPSPVAAKSPLLLKDESKDEAPSDEPPSAVVGGVPGGVVGGVVGGVPAPPPPSTAVTPPKAISTPPPAYPPDAKAQGKEGKVVARLEIDEQGKVVDTKILSGEPPFTDAVRAATPSWRFAPARAADGTAVRGSTLINVPFRLD